MRNKKAIKTRPVDPSAQSKPKPKARAPKPTPEPKQSGTQAGTIRDSALAAIEEHGPHTARDLANRLGCRNETASNALRGLAKDGALTREQRDTGAKGSKPWVYSLPNDD